MEKQRNSFIENLLSFRNEGTHKVITVFGFKIKIKLKRLVLERILEQQKQELEQQKQELGAFMSDKNLIDIYNKSKKWIYINTISEKGIVVQSTSEGSNIYEGIAYPEVTGYFIPSLLNWGHRKLAIQYAKWLVNIQHRDGSWFDYFDNSPYIFDTAQVLKGLIAIYPIMPEVKDSILKGCDWIISKIEENGRLQFIDRSLMQLSSTTELIHLYCLSPLVDAGKLFNKPEYIEITKKVLSYYKGEINKILDFHTLSHFYAYILDALLDLGEIDLVKQAMEKVSKLQRKSGAVPAYKNVEWVCSVGLFQFSIIWYKLREKERADRAFDFACSMQNESGGWYGSKGEGADYNPKDEISWANKYFLDALSLKISTHFASTGIESTTDEYPLVDKIQNNDGRLLTVLHNISKSSKVLEVGCGFGRILKEVKKQYPDVEAYGIDLDESILQRLPSEINSKVGSILKIPYEDNTFDFVFCVEVLEHAIDIENAIEELFRVTKPGGKVLILDKNIECWGKYQTPTWEQWFDKKDLVELMKKWSIEISVLEDIPYDDNDGKEGLFMAWTGRKKI
ncbi:MAG: methyltransferase domain-containing protein [Endomicrobium sp.]|jgi:malonyl-CoA O-methyltransferase|uniref:methyltransferase domain-containing protein n=1 Tax=Candidatus Endomicrobiellum cubanum TaxID=3242325 RepID=UPI002821462D|nr:methyltransferase domain-containing protein [Endomicrobium sp.]